MASAVIAVYVVHSWEWIALGAAFFVVFVVLELWSRLDERIDLGSEIDSDIEARQHRQDEQLVKTYPHL